MCVCSQLVQAVFPEQRQYILTTSHGGFAGVESAEW
jgi:hypothetical protein